MPKERNKAEPDVEADEGVASSRATGGVPDPSQPDQHSTTGTTPNETFVGRVTGSDVGYSEETGAERRAEPRESGPGGGEAPSPPG
jgi:hypothetical protein